MIVVAASAKSMRFIFFLHRNGARQRLFFTGIIPLGGNFIQADHSNFRTKNPYS
jgi:hypothetical protein